MSIPAGDKRTLELPDGQKRLLARVVATGKPVVVVLACGSALRVEDGNAILWGGYPGQAGGDALADHPVRQGVALGQAADHVLSQSGRSARVHGLQHEGSHLSLLRGRGAVSLWLRA